MPLNANTSWIPGGRSKVSWNWMLKKVRCLFFPSSCLILIRVELNGEKWAVLVKYCHYHMQQLNTQHIFSELLSAATISTCSSVSVKIIKLQPLFCFLMLIRCKSHLTSDWLQNVNSCGSLSKGNFLNVSSNSAQWFIRYFANRQIVSTLTTDAKVWGEISHAMCQAQSVCCELLSSTNTPIFFLIYIKFNKLKLF